MTSDEKGKQREEKPHEGPLDDDELAEGLSDAARTSDGDSNPHNDMNFGVTPGIIIGAGREEAETKPDGQVTYKLTPYKSTFVDLIDWSPAGLAQTLGGLSGECAWFSGNTWVEVKDKDGKVSWRSSKGWRGSWAITQDYDTGAHEQLPAEAAEKLMQAAKGGKLPGHVFYLTPGGFRIVVLLSAFCTDPKTHRRLHDALAAATAAALRDIEVNEVAVDKGSFEPARIFYAPNAFAKGVQRKSEVIVMRDSMNFAEELLREAAAQGEQPLEAEAKAVDEADGGPSPTYVETKEGIVYNKPVKGGIIPTLLSNFTARIVADVFVDDGAEVSRHFQLSARIGNLERSFTIPAHQFWNVQRWAAEHLGATAVVFPGHAAESHIKTAIQVFSEGLTHKRVYRHLGWTTINGENVYLHAGGGIGPGGPVPGVEVSLPGKLKEYLLPEPPTGTNLEDAVRCSLSIRKVTKTYVGLILLMVPYRAALGWCDTTPMLDGVTGAGKSELVALAMQHFGAGLDRNNLPGNWNDTPNSMIAVAFYGKDTLYAFDDFVPKGNFLARNDLQRKADTVLRAQGNTQGRGRANVDGSLREERPPRGMAIITGEDAPQGESIRARLAIMTLGGKLGTKDSDVLAIELTRLQKAARDSQLAASVSAYVQWLAVGDRRDQIGGQAHKLKEWWRTNFRGVHSRTPDTLAELELGLLAFEEFAVAAGAVTEAEALELRTAGREALHELGRAQQAYLASADPAKAFVQSLASGFATGHCHVRDHATQKVPLGSSESWGWRSEDMDHKAMGEHVGWIDGPNVYLLPDAAVRVAYRLASSSGDSLDASKRSLGRILKEKGYLVKTDAGRTDSKVRIAKSRPRVWIIPASHFLDDPGPSGPDEEEAVGSDAGAAKDSEKEARDVGPIRPQLDEDERLELRDYLFQAGKRAEADKRRKMGNDQPDVASTKTPAPLAPVSETSSASSLPSLKDLKRKGGTKFDRAVRSYNKDHERDWGKGGRESCPICGHNGCFGRLPDMPERWHCFSSDHEKHPGADGNPVGLQGESGWHGDALDVDAFKAGCSRTEHLTNEGYLGCDQSKAKPKKLKKTPAKKTGVAKKKTGKRKAKTQRKSRRNRPIRATAVEIAPSAATELGNEQGDPDDEVASLDDWPDFEIDNEDDTDDEEPEVLS